MQTITTVTPASVLPVSVADLQAFLRLNETAEDDLLEDWITSAADLFARQTGYVLTATVLRLALDQWPTSGVVSLPATPVTAVASVTYLDTAGSWSTLSGTVTDLDGTPARVVLPDSVPDLYHQGGRQRVRVQFTAGHALAADVPKLAAQGVKLLCSHWYETRSAYTDSQFAMRDVPQGWRAICDQFDTGIIGEWN